jgi:hypothetical protein
MYVRKLPSKLIVGLFGLIRVPTTLLFFSFQENRYAPYKQTFERSPMEPYEVRALSGRANQIAGMLDRGDTERATQAMQTEVQNSMQRPDGATRVAVLANEIRTAQREHEDRGGVRPMARLHERTEGQDACGTPMDTLRVHGYDARMRREVDIKIAHIPAGLAQDFYDGRMRNTPVCNNGNYYDGAPNLYNRAVRVQPQYDPGYRQPGYDPRYDNRPAPRVEYPPQGVIIQENPVEGVVRDLGSQFLRGFGRELGSNAADNIIRRRQDVYIHGR